MGEAISETNLPECDLQTLEIFRSDHPHDSLDLRLPLPLLSFPLGGLQTVCHVTKDPNFLLSFHPPHYHLQKVCGYRKRREGEQS